MQRKVTVTLIVILCALVALSYLALNATVAPAFDRLERSVATTNLVRVQRAIESDIANLASIAGDWAPWDEAHSFVRGQNPGFYEENINHLTFENLGVEYLMFFDAAGTNVGRRLRQDGKLVDSSQLDFFNPSNPEYSALFVHDSADDHKEGLIQTDLGPSLIAARPIVLSNREGPIAGTVVIGRFMDDRRQQRLQEWTEVGLKWYVIDDVTRATVPMRDELVNSGSGYIHHAAGNDAIRSYRLLDDVFGEPLLVLQTDTPRQISTLGGSTVGATLLLISAVGIVLAAVSWWLLRTRIATPLERIARHISNIRESGDLSRRLDERRADEIGILAGEFDLMAGELQNARRLLLQQSFNAGKADTAAALLHNVRNAMTPLVNGIDALARNVGFVSSMRVSRAVEELRAGNCTPERRKALLQYLRTAFDHVRTMSDTTVTDLQVASRQARQVEVILSEQEKFAIAAPVIEEFELLEVMEEAVMVIPAGDTRK
ncbi:MAG: CHASE4 domain-containing protein [Woeseiaceae bacterium]|nr:CHASE4 domain-containing protein [Woeseiaceae bacterium]